MDMKKDHASKLICIFNNYYVTLMVKIYIDSNRIKKNQFIKLFL